MLCMSYYRVHRKAIQMFQKAQKNFKLFYNIIIQMAKVMAYRCSGLLCILNTRPNDLDLLSVSLSVLCVCCFFLFFFFSICWRLWDAMRYLARQKGIRGSREKLTLQTWEEISICTVDSFNVHRVSLREKTGHPYAYRLV